MIKYVCGPVQRCTFDKGVWNKNVQLAVEVLEPKQVFFPLFHSDIKKKLTSSVIVQTKPYYYTSHNTMWQTC